MSSLSISDRVQCMHDSIWNYSGAITKTPTSLANMWIWSPSCMTAGSPRIHSRKSGGSRMGLKAESKTQGFPPGSHSPSGPFEIVEFSLLAWKDLHLVTIENMYMKELCLIVNVNWLCEKFSLRIHWVSYRTTSSGLLKPRILWTIPNVLFKAVFFCVFFWPYIMIICVLKLILSKHLKGQLDPPVSNGNVFCTKPPCE